MKELEIVDTAIENLNRNLEIESKWRVHPIKEIDGTLELFIDKVGYLFNVEVVKELRSYQIKNLSDKAKQHKPLLVITNHLFPKIKEELRQLDIAYLEANGNIYVRAKGLRLWIDNNKPIKQEIQKANRAFTKTGVKVIFHFLLNDQMVNTPYREIAETTGVALGNINYIIHGLKDTGYLINLDSKRYKLYNKRALLDKWITAYIEKLKPTLILGKFRFLDDKDFSSWKSLKLQNNKTWWGGEPAGDLLTNYLRPGELTIYTEETKNEIIKQLRLVPDESGNVKVYKKFWQYSEVNDNIVPPLLVYADLISNNDSRLKDIADKVFNDLLKNDYESI